jgi:ADP-ribose pyrophosphatase YjhB (NUDIX family)
MHTISTVYVADGSGHLLAADDAANVEVFQLENLPEPLCFDHAAILKDYAAAKLA